VNAKVKLSNWWVSACRRNTRKTAEDDAPDIEQYRCTLEEAIEYVQRDPFSVVEKLYGVGLDEDLNLKWRLMGVSRGRGRKGFDLDLCGTVESMEIDEDAFIDLITRTKNVYLPLSHFL